MSSGFARLQWLTSLLLLQMLTTSLCAKSSKPTSLSDMAMAEVSTHKLVVDHGGFRGSFDRDEFNFALFRVSFNQPITIKKMGGRSSSSSPAPNRVTTTTTDEDRVAEDPEFFPDDDEVVSAAGLIELSCPGRLIESFALAQPLNGSRSSGSTKEQEKQYFAGLDLAKHLVLWEDLEGNTPHNMLKLIGGSAVVPQQLSDRELFAALLLDWSHIEASAVDLDLVADEQSLGRRGQRKLGGALKARYNSNLDQNTLLLECQLQVRGDKQQRAIWLQKSRKILNEGTLSLTVVHSEDRNGSVTVDSMNTAINLGRRLFKSAIEDYAKLRRLSEADGTPTSLAAIEAAIRVRAEAEARQTGNLLDFPMNGIIGGLKSTFSKLIDGLVSQPLAKRLMSSSLGQGLEDSLTDQLVQKLVPLTNAHLSEYMQPALSQSLSASLEEVSLVIVSVGGVIVSVLTLVGETQRLFLETWTTRFLLQQAKNSERG